MELTGYKIKDFYTGKIVHSATTGELSEWLRKSYATLTTHQEEMIDCLEESFEKLDEHGIKWYGVACGLTIEPAKKKRRRTKK